MARKKFRFRKQLLPRPIKATTAVPTRNVQSASIAKLSEGSRLIPNLPEGEEAKYGNTQIYTYFTVPDVQQSIYSATRWVQIKLLLETAGPVAYSTRQNILPVLSGKGALLVTGESVNFTLAAGDRLFIASTTVNRIQFIVEPFPWLENITMSIKNLFKR